MERTSAARSVLQSRHCGNQFLSSLSSLGLLFDSQGLCMKFATGYGSSHETQPNGNERPFGSLLMRQNDGWENDWDLENHFAIHHFAKRNGLRPV